MTSHDALDHAIDLAARGIVHAPVPDLRHRVIARLPAGRPSRRPRWVVWVAPAAAVAAAIVLTVGLWTRAGTLPPLPAVGPAPAIGTTAAAAIALPPPAVVPAPRPIDTTAPPEPSAAELAWEARAVPALADPDPVTIVAIQPAPPEIPLLGVTPLATAPIVMPPVGGRAPRDRR